MDGLQAVARVGQRPAHDGGESVGKIALLQRVAQVDVDRRLRRLRRRNGFGHRSALARALSRGKGGGRQIGVARQRGIVGRLSLRPLVRRDAAALASKPIRGLRTRD